MHELGLLTGVVSHINAQVPDRDVAVVHLEVGSLSGVDREALEGAWPLARWGTCEKANLDIVWVTASIWCTQCNSSQPIDEYFDLRCPTCKKPTANLVKGKEFNIQSIDVYT